MLPWVIEEVWAIWLNDSADLVLDKEIIDGNLRYSVSSLILKLEGGSRASSFWVEE